MQIEKTQIEKTQIEDSDFDWPEDDDAVVQEAIRVAAAAILKVLKEAITLRESTHVSRLQAEGLYASAYAMKNLAATSNIRAETINDVEQTFFDSPYFAWVTAMGENATIVRNAAVANMNNYLIACKQYVRQCQTLAARAVELTYVASLEFGKVFTNSSDASRNDGAHYADLASDLYPNVLNDLIEVMKVCNDIIQQSHNVSKLLDKLPVFPEASLSES